MRRLVFVFAAATGLFATSCFKVDEPGCSYSCSDDGECPSNYTCASDGYCHRNGYTGECAFGGVDMSVVDGASTD